MLQPSERLEYRSPQLSDAISLLSIYSNKVAMKYRATPPITTMPEAIEMITTALEKAAAQEQYRIIVVEKTSKKPIGTLLFTPEGKTSCTIGYSLGQTYWKKGYGKEMVSALLGFLKDNGYETIEAFTHHKNAASIAILEGFEFIQKTKENSDSNILHWIYKYKT